MTARVATVRRLGMAGYQRWRGMGQTTVDCTNWANWVTDSDCWSMMPSDWVSYYAQEANVPALNPPAPVPAITNPSLSTLTAQTNAASAASIAASGASQVSSLPSVCDPTSANYNLTYCLTNELGDTSSSLTSPSATAATSQLASGVNAGVPTTLPNWVPWAIGGAVVLFLFAAAKGRR